MEVKPYVKRIRVKDPTSPTGYEFEEQVIGGTAVLGGVEGDDGRFYSFDELEVR